MLKIALVNPLTPDGNFVPPLGLLIIASVLEKEGHNILIFDQNMDEDIITQIKDYHPDIVGITAVTSAVLNGKQLASELKKELPSVITVFGGPHPTSMCREVISWADIDFVVISEGENSMRMLVKWVNEKGLPYQLEKIPNLYFKKDGIPHFTFEAEWLSSEEIDHLPLPAYNLLDFDRISSRIRHGVFRKGKRVLPYMATRGCPQMCTFCCRHMGRRIRRKNPELVLNEIEYLIKTYSLDEIYLEDDNFTSSKQYAMTIIDGIIERKFPVSIKFANGVRIDTLDNILLEKLRHAGCYALSFGLESGSPKVLQLMKKGLDLEKVRSAVSMVKSHGFLVGANMIIGYPGETEDDIWESYDFFESLKLDSVAVVNIIPFPGTVVRKICEENGYLTEEAKSWNNYYFDIKNPKILIETEYLKKKQLKSILKKIFFRLYTNPRRVAGLLKNMQPSDILAAAKMFTQKIISG